MINKISKLTQQTFSKQMSVDYTIHHPHFNLILLTNISSPRELYHHRISLSNTYIYRTLCRIDTTTTTTTTYIAISVSLDKSKPCLVAFTLPHTYRVHLQELLEVVHVKMILMVLGVRFATHSQFRERAKDEEQRRRIGCINGSTRS